METCALQGFLDRPPDLARIEPFRLCHRELDHEEGPEIADRYAVESCETFCSPFVKPGQIIVNFTHQVHIPGFHRLEVVEDRLYMGVGVKDELDDCLFRDAQPEERLQSRDR